MSCKNTSGEMDPLGRSDTGRKGEGHIDTTSMYYIYRISLNTSRGYYFFPHYEAAGTIQGREHIKGRNYSRKYGIYMYMELHVHVYSTLARQPLYPDTCTFCIIHVYYNLYSNLHVE